MTEGIFPKVNGTPLYASEINNLYTDILGHGLVTISGNNTRQAAWNFSTNRALGDGIIILEFMERHSVSPGSMTWCMGTTATGSELIIHPQENHVDMEFKIMQSPSTAGNIDVLSLSAVKSSLGSAYNAKQSSTAFNVSAAETFYFNTDPPTGTNSRIHWVATLIPGD